MHQKNVSLRLFLDVAYDLNGTTPADMAAALEKMCHSAVGNGLLTGSTPAEVSQWSVKVVTVPEPLAEEALAAYMKQRIEDGDLSLEDVPVRLARYGLMDPHEFTDEMRERMNAASDQG